MSKSHGIPNPLGHDAVLYAVEWRLVYISLLTLNTIRLKCYLLAHIHLVKSKTCLALTCSLNLN